MWPAYFVNWIIKLDLLSYTLRMLACVLMSTTAASNDAQRYCEVDVYSGNVIFFYMMVISPKKAGLCCMLWWLISSNKCLLVYEHLPSYALWLSESFWLLLGKSISSRIMKPLNAIWSIQKRIRLERIWAWCERNLSN